MQKRRQRENKTVKIGRVKQGSLKKVSGKKRKTGKANIQSKQTIAESSQTYIKRAFNETMSHSLYEEETSYWSIISNDDVEVEEEGDDEEQRINEYEQEQFPDDPDLVEEDEKDEFSPLELNIKSQDEDNKAADIVFFIKKSGKNNMLDFRIPAKNYLAVQRQYYKEEPVSFFDWDKRSQVLEEIAMTIIDKDKDFFYADPFDISLLQNISQQSIAEKTNTDKSLISRVKNNCWALTPQWGLLPLNMFFPVTSKKNQIDVSEKAMERTIRDAIDSEPLDKPFYPEQLGSLLPEEIKRDSYRGVRNRLKKYGIPNRSQRLKLFDLCKTVVMQNNGIDKGKLYCMVVEKIDQNNLFRQSVLKEFTHQRIKQILGET